MVMRYLLQILALWTFLSSSPNQQSHYFNSNLLPGCQAQGLIPDVLEANTETQSFSEAIAIGGLDGLLNGVGPFTVFAPSNGAVAADLDPKYLEPMWMAHLTEILLQHIVEGRTFTTESWQVGLTVNPISGRSLAVTGLDPFTLNDDVIVTTPDVSADNGVIQIIDSVVLPPSARDTIMDIITVIPEFFSILNNLLILSNLDDTLQSDGPFTMFAPSNSAFEDLNPDVLANLQNDPDALRRVLEYHMVEGIYLIETLQQPDVTDLPTLNGELLPKPIDNIDFVDLLATNGVMHIVNTVLLPPEDATDGPVTPAPVTPAPVPATPAPVTNAPTSAAPLTDAPVTPIPATADPQPAPTTPDTPAPVTDAPAPATDEPVTTEAPVEVVGPPPPFTSTGTIVEILLAENFTVMVGALNQTEWFETLNNVAGSYTLLAVPNNGFGPLPAKFLEDPVLWNSHLSNALTYHILAGSVLFEGLTVNASLATLNANNNVTITSDVPFQVNDVNITQTDYPATNGLIQVIEEVLLPPSATDTAFDILQTFPQQFSTLEGLIRVANLTSLFDGEGPLTAFAPTNEAFEALPEGTLEQLANDVEALRNLLLYHATPRLADFANVFIGRPVVVPTFLPGANATLSRNPIVGEPLTPRIDNATVIFFDLLVQNGLVHVIDRVLVPPDITVPETNVTSAPTVATTVAPEEPTPTPIITTGTPTSGAFDTDAPTSVDVPVIETFSPTAVEEPELTIMDAVRTDPRFTTLNQLLEAAGLGSFLDQPGEFTLFAPNNFAFSKLPDGTLDALQNAPDALSDILLYHILDSDVVLLGELEEGSVYETVQGQSVVISQNGDDVLVNDAIIRVPDVEFSNGVIHIIETVLIPPPITATDSPTTAPLAVTDSPTALPDVATSSPTITDTDTAVTPAPTSLPGAITLAPSGGDDDKCVAIPGQVVCCPPGQVDGIYFFCRYI